MKIHHYLSSTGEYTCTTDAIANPLEPGNFLIPACATEIPPPEVGENKIAVFSNLSWSIFDDFRGTDYWTSHNEKHTILSIGETVPKGAFLEQPDPEPPTQEQLSNQARTDRDAKLSATTWIVDRHRDEQETGETTLTAQQYAELMAYRQALRDVPQQAGFPESIQWPALPEFLNDVLQ